jgi:hypothetical protein
MTKKSEVETSSTEKGSQFYFDWIDAIVIMFSFLGLIGSAVVIGQFIDTDGVLFELILEVSIIPVFLAGLFLRRRLFGPGFPYPIKTGGIWSLISILGLFILLGAGLSSIFAGMSLVRSFEKSPEFELSIPENSNLLESSASFAELDAFIKMQQPNENKEEWSARLKREREEEKSRKEEARKVKKDAKINAWKKRIKEQQSYAWHAGYYAAMLFSFGVILLRLRQDRTTPKD